MNAEFAPLFQLGRAERLQLVEDLWDSITLEPHDQTIPEWKRIELLKRRERFAADPSTGKTWDQVKELARG